jgi:DNA-binding NarL/FixJ family response regulator
MRDAAAVLPEIVMIALSGHGEYALKRRAFDAGFDCYYVKGVPFREVRIGLHQALERRRLVFPHEQYG